MEVNWIGCLIPTLYKYDAEEINFEKQVKCRILYIYSSLNTENLSSHCFYCKLDEGLLVKYIISQFLK